MFRLSDSSLHLDEPLDTSSFEQEGCACLLCQGDRPWAEGDWLTSPLYWVRDHSLWKVLPRVRAGLPISASLVQITPHQHDPRLISWLVLDPAKPATFTTLGRMSMPKPILIAGVWKDRGPHMPIWTSVAITGLIQVSSLKVVSIRNVLHKKNSWGS